MEITEKDLEDLIFEDLRTGGYNLIRRGFNCELISDRFPNRIFWYRQVPLKSYGIADIIGFSRWRGMIHVAVIELKNVPIQAADFEQLFRYRQAVKTILKNSFKHATFNIECILVGPSISSGHYIHNVCRSTVVEFTYSLSGVEFQSHEGGWFRTDCKGMNLRDIKCANEIVIPGVPSVVLASNHTDNGKAVH